MNRVSTPAYIAPRKAAVIATAAAARSLLAQKKSERARRLKALQANLPRQEQPTE
jgi:ribosomal protein L9